MLHFLSTPRRRAVLGAALLALAPALTALLPASALGQKLVGKISGHMYLENPVWAEAKDPAKKGYSFREMVPTVPAQYRRLYPHAPKEICLAALAAGPQPSQPPTLIRVGGGRTTPVTIVVTPGTKLVFKNTDPFSHMLYAVDVKEFSPNETTKGSTREWTVPSAGTFEIRDKLAPSLRMWVVAEPNVAAITYPTMSGDFHLKVDAEGQYQVQAYFAGKKVGSAQPAEVAAGDVSLKPIVVATPEKESK
jgi:hypothetical protein